MIGLTGKEERELRAFADALEVRPPLVNLLREAVRVYLVTRAKDATRTNNEKMRAWQRQWYKDNPPFQILR